jgi:hypothetical protein
MNRLKPLNPLESTGVMRITYARLLRTRDFKDFKPAQSGGII